MRGVVLSILAATCLLATGGPPAFGAEPISIQPESGTWGTVVRIVGPALARRERPRVFLTPQRASFESPVPRRVRQRVRRVGKQAVEVRVRGVRAADYSLVVETRSARRGLTSSSLNTRTFRARGPEFGSLIHSSVGGVPALSIEAENPRRSKLRVFLGGRELRTLRNWGTGIDVEAPVDLPDGEHPLILENRVGALAADELIRFGSTGLEPVPVPDAGASGDLVGGFESPEAVAGSWLRADGQLVMSLHQTRTPRGGYDERSILVRVPAAAFAGFAGPTTVRSTEADVYRQIDRDDMRRVQGRWRTADGLSVNVLGVDRAAARALVEISGRLDSEVLQEAPTTLLIRGLRTTVELPEFVEERETRWSLSFSPLDFSGITNRVQIDDRITTAETFGYTIAPFGTSRFGGRTEAYTLSRRDWLLPPEFGDVILYSDDDYRVGEGDALLVEFQASLQDGLDPTTASFGAIGADQETLDPALVSEWQPALIWDRTGIEGGAFGELTAQPLTEGAGPLPFDLSALNGRGFLFLRARARFVVTDEDARVGPSIDRVQFEVTFRGY